MSDDSVLDGADALQGWKEIAAYLGRSPRTAQRWEAELGLPVQRIVAPDGSQLLRASRQHIDAWRERQTALGAREDLDAEPAPEAAASVQPDPATRRRPWPMRWAAVLSATFLVGIVLGGLFAIALVPARRTPTRFVVEGTAIKALTESDATVWTYPLGATGRRPDGMGYSESEQGDVDGDGVPEVAVAVTQARPETLATESDSLFLFSRDGRLRWRVQPGPEPKDGQTPEGPWRMSAVAFSTAPAGLTWIAFNHDQPGRRSIVLEITADGRQSVRYQQAGRIHVLTPWRTASADYLAVGGTDEATSLASVVLLPRGGAPALWTGGALEAACAECPREPPAAAYLFPMSELNEAFSRPRGFVFRLLSIGGRLRVGTDDGPRAALLAWIDADLRVREVQRPIRYWTTHEALQAEGRIDHTVDACPDRLTPTSIRVWRTGSGWAEDSVGSPESSR